MDRWTTSNGWQRIDLGRSRGAIELHRPSTTPRDSSIGQLFQTHHHSAMKTILRPTLYLVVSLAALTCSAAPIQPVSAPYRASATGAGNSHSPVFSADGRHIAFVSQANNLVTND